MNSKKKMVLIYSQVERIYARKMQRHRCDSECKANEHRYYHDFKPGAMMYGLPDKTILIKPR